MFKAEVTWTEALEKCKAMGGYLVVPTSEEENNFAGKLLDGTINVYLGGKRIKDQWVWITGEKMEWKNWKHGQGVKHGAQDIMIYWNDPPLWHDHPGDRKERGFVCEWEF